MRSQFHDETGAISIMVAVLTVALLVAGALAVDVGRMAYVSRDQQGATDRAAMDASWVLDGLEGDEALADVHAQVRAAAIQTLEANPASGSSEGRALTNVEIGFVADDLFYVMWDDNGAGPWAFAPTSPTAVRATTDSYVSFVLAINDAQGGRDIQKVAVVDRAPTATISIGTRLVDFDTNRALYAALVNDLIGGAGGLSLVGFDGLAHVWVSPEVLGENSVTAGSPDALLETEVVFVDMVDAMIAEMQAGVPDPSQTVPDSDPGEVEDSDATYAEVIAALQEIRDESDPAMTFTVGQIMEVAGTDLAAFRDGQINALDLLVRGMLGANEGNLVNLSLEGPDALGLLGVNDVAIELDIIEAAQSATGPARFVPANDLDGDGLIEEGEESFWVTTANTAQIDIGIDFSIDGSRAEDLLGSLYSLIPLPTVPLPGVCGSLLLPPCDVELSLQAQAAEGEAWLTQVVCPTDADADGHAETDFMSEAFVVSLNGADYRLVDAREHDVTDLSTPQYPRRLERVTDRAVVQLEAAYPDEIPEAFPTPPWDLLDPLPDLPIFGQSLEAMLAMLGLDLGHAVVGWEGVNCTNRQLQPFQVGD